MSKTQKSVRVCFEAPSRFLDDHEDVLAPAYQAAWRDASRLASRRTYAHRGAKVVIEVDWSAIARREIREVKSLRQQDDGPEKGREMSNASLDIAVPALVTMERGSDPAVHHPDWAACLQYHIANVFVAMNLAAPGCATLRSRRTCEGPWSGVNFEGIEFEFAWHASLNDVGPKISTVPLETCFRWLEPLESRFVHVARSRRERIAIAMLQIAGMDCSPQSAVWLWYALEALVRPAPRNTFRQVNDYICRLLGLNHAQAVTLEQSLRPLYEIRSEFTHGKLPLIHPVGTDQFGKDVDSEMDRYASAHTAGVNILLACAQARVRRM